MFAMSDPASKPHKDELPRLWTYIWRSLWLKCPECGISPVFTRFRTVRSLFDWFVPLDGCPRCGFAYRREEGYFMAAICAVNYGLVAGPAIALALLFEVFYPLAIWQYVVFLFLPMAPVSFLIARHAKSLWLAIDHYFDPQGPGKRATEKLLAKMDDQART